ncbi:hypothetical protein [Mariniphaga sp.]|uniref:hypothetical protein n=1 Tax=Mariniphaga sp. TaxID=1954475 RepID=UPI003564AE30
MLYNIEERFLVVQINLIFRSLTLVVCGFPENPTLFNLITGNKVNKVCGGVWWAATEVEDEENKVYFGTDGSFGAELVILNHLLNCCFITQSSSRRIACLVAA